MKYSKHLLKTTYNGLDLVPMTPNPASPERSSFFFLSVRLFGLLAVRETGL